MPLEQYVNDRPYVCSSFMSVALARVFGQTMNGVCKKRPELVNTVMPFSCRISVLPCRGGEAFLRRLFEPLGYMVSTTPYLLDEMFPDWGQSSYFTVELARESTLAELFNHLYVLIPVLDNQKHYYIDRAEIDKLLKRGEGWLAAHPEKEQIAKRFLKYRTSYAYEALERLMDVNPADNMGETMQSAATDEDVLESRLNLNDERLGVVLAAIKSVEPKTVLDLGCGEGKLLRLLLKDSQIPRIVGLDVSIRALENAAERLRLQQLPSKQRERIELIHGSLMYRDRRLEGFDVAAVIEVIEHLDEPRLKACERVIFEFARPKTVILTTPNREYNVMWEAIGPEKMRHGDHRFEWTRAEFMGWASRIANQFGYDVSFLKIGIEVDAIGAPTQMAVFTLKAGKEMDVNGN